MGHLVPISVKCRNIKKCLISCFWYGLCSVSLASFQAHKQRMYSFLTCQCQKYNSFCATCTVLNLSCCWSFVTSLPFASVTNMTYDILPLHQWNVHSTFAWLIDRSMCAVTFMNRKLCARFIPTRTQISISSVKFACNFPRICRFTSVQYVSGSLALFPSRIAVTTVSVFPAHPCCPVNWEIVGEAKADVARNDKFSVKKKKKPSHTHQWTRWYFKKNPVGFCCVQNDTNVESILGLEVACRWQQRVLNFLL